MRAGLIQLCSSDRPEDNLAAASDLIRQAAADGAHLVLTPQVTNCVSLSRSHQKNVLREEDDDPVLAGLRDLAAELGIHVLIGSLALKTGGERFANRSFLVGPDGAVIARYDKIHMFDVEIGGGEAYRESDGYRPGSQAVTAPLPGATLGMTVCYDLRFPALYRSLAQAGAGILSIPSAFTVPTGQAHWEPLLRARAIETGAFVLAPAQTGTHPAGEGRKQRRTYGHSLAVDPWGEVLLDMGESPGAAVVELDLDAIAHARKRIPSLTHDRAFGPPDAL